MSEIPRWIRRRHGCGTRRPPPTRSRCQATVRFVQPFSRNLFSCWVGAEEVAVNGSAAAEFSDFAHSRWPRLVRLAYGITGDRGLAEDLAQTALANAYKSWSRVRRAEDPDAYLRRIVINAHRGGLRKRRVTEQLSEAPPAATVADPAQRAQRAGAGHRCAAHAAAPAAGGAGAEVLAGSDRGPGRGDARLLCWQC